MTVDLTAEELAFMEKLDAMMAELPLVLKWIKEKETYERRFPLPRKPRTSRRRY